MGLLDDRNWTFVPVRENTGNLPQNPNREQLPYSQLLLFFA